MARYVIADPDQGAGWGHIFEEVHENGKKKARERMLRFVFDLESEALAHLDVQWGQKWIEGSRFDREDVEDSLKNANPEALEDPEDWGLIASDELPDWAQMEEMPSP